MDVYKSIKSPSEGLYKELGSRFMAFAHPVESEEEVKSILDGIRKEYHDARHCCYAYRLGRTEVSRFRANDDGEPSGTGGRPILAQIDSAGLSDVLVVVVRYFGGIKLGVPGLARAYRAACADALQTAQVVEKTDARYYRISFGYLSMNSVMKTVKDLQLPLSEQEYGQTCSLKVRVRLSLENQFVERMHDIGDCAVEILD